MKNLVFLIISFFCFCMCISCGDESFEPYSYEGYDKSKGLLPYEFIQVKTDNTGTQITVKTVLEYDNKNRLIFSQTSTLGIIGISQYITYNESNGKVNTVKTILSPSSEFMYTYEYPEKNKILEHVSSNGIDTQTNTLFFDPKRIEQPRLLYKDDPDMGITYYGFDAVGNLTKEGSNLYYYDTAPGIMCRVKTPHWLFHTLEGNLPFTYNLVNNIIIDGVGSSYVYDEFTYSQYPQKVIINGDEEITVKYKLAK